MGRGHWTPRNRRASGSLRHDTPVFGRFGLAALDQLPMLSQVDGQSAAPSGWVEAMPVQPALSLEDAINALPFEMPIVADSEDPLNPIDRPLQGEESAPQ